MADKITEIVDQSAFDQVSVLKSEVKDLRGEFVGMFKDVNKLKESLGTSKSMQDFSVNVNKAKSGLSELDKVKKSIIATNEKIEAQETLYGQLLAESKLNQQQSNKETKESIKLKQAEAGSIDELRIRLAQAQKAYDAMGKSARESTGKDLLTNIQKLDTELKKLENTTGRYQRSVGNYRNETFALSQVLREVPSFTYSATTGFLAMTNNLPILADSFTKVKNSVNETTGKVNGVTGAMNIFAKSMFSWGNIFTMAIAVFTIFSKQIIEAFTGVKELDKGVQDLYKSVGTEIGKFTTLNTILNDSTLSSKEHLNAANNLIQMYPTLLKNYSAEEVAAGKAAGAIEKIKDALISVAFARAAQTKIDEAAGKRLSNEERYNTLLAERTKLAAGLNPSNERVASMSGQALAAEMESYANRLKDVDAEMKSIVSDNVELDRVILKMSQNISKFNVSAAAGGINDGYGTPPNDGYGTPPKAKKPKKEKTPKEIDRIAELKSLFENEKKISETAYKNGEIDYLNYQLSLLEIATTFAKNKLLVSDDLTKKEKDSAVDLQNTIASTSQEAWKGMKESGEAAMKELNDSHKKGVKEASDNITKMANEVGVSFAKVDKVIINLGKRTLKELIEDLTKVLETASKIFAVIGDLGSEVAGLIADKANAQADQQIKNIDRLEQAQLDSLSRLTMADKQREEERKKIEVQAKARRDKAERDRITSLRKAAAIQKAADIANIISGTALAIVNALKTQPTYLGIALAAGVGITGGIQLARAASAPLPQYKHGRDDGKAELAIVGDGGVHEVIENKDGSLSLTPNTPTITHLSEGARVHANMDDFLDHVYRTALVKLSFNNNITTSMMSKALEDSFGELRDEMRGVKNEIKKLDLRVNIQDTYNHNVHVQSKVR